MKKHLLKYSLEFLVIVMGISVSFWLNNWTENNKYKKARNEFLISLKQELILDTIQLSKKIADFSSINDNVIKGIALIDKFQHTEIEKNEFQSAIIPIMKLTPHNKNTQKKPLQKCKGFFCGFNLGLSQRIDAPTNIQIIQHIFLTRPLASQLSV